MRCKSLALKSCYFTEIGDKTTFSGLQKGPSELTVTLKTAEMFVPRGLTQAWLLLVFGPEGLPACEIEAFWR